MSKIKIGVQVTAKVCPTKVAVSGTFQGYELQDREDPTSVCGKVFYVKDGMQRLDFVYVDSIKVFESEDERIRKHLVEVLELYWGKTNDPGKAADLAYLERMKEQQPDADLKKAAQHVYESWMGGTMDDVRRDMVELGKVLDARKKD